MNADLKGRLAVVTGPGGFASRLCHMLTELNVDHRVFGWFQHRPNEHLIPVNDPEDCVQIFREHDVTDVVHAGTFNVMTELFPLARKLRNPGAAFESAGELRERFYRPYAAALEKAGITPHTPGDLFDCFKPQLGPMGALRLTSEDKERLNWLREKAAELLRDRRHTFGLSQTVVFDDDRDMAVATGSINTMLKRLTPPEAGRRRTVIKLLPEDFPPKLDPPTIGTVTVRHAINAGVQILAIDVANGTVVDRAATASAADQAGIRLVGV